MTAATADIPTARGTDQSRTYVHASTIRVRHTPISRKYQRCRRMSCSLAGHGTSVTESTHLSRRISPRLLARCPGGGRRITVSVPDEVDLNVEAELGDVNELEIELTW